MDPEMIYNRVINAIKLDSEIAAKVFNSLFALDSCRNDNETVSLWSIRKNSNLSNEQIFEGLETLERLKLLHYLRINKSTLKLSFSGYDLRGVLYILRSSMFNGGLNKEPLKVSQDPKGQKKKKRVFKKSIQSLDSKADFVNEIFGGDLDKERGMDNSKGKIKKLTELELIQNPSIRPEYLKWKKLNLEDWNLNCFIGFYLSRFKKIQKKEDTSFQTPKKKNDPKFFRLMRFAKIHFPPDESENGKFDKQELKEYIDFIIDWSKTEDADWMNEFNFFIAFDPNKPFFVNLFREYQNGKLRIKRRDRDWQSAEAWEHILK